jgi:hypothetical protein
MTNPNQILLTREQLLARLNERGYPIKASAAGRCTGLMMLSPGQSPGAPQPPAD